MFYQCCWLLGSRESEEKLKIHSFQDVRSCLSVAAMLEDLCPEIKSHPHPAHFSLTPCSWSVSNPHWSTARGSSCPPWITKAAKSKARVPQQLQTKPGTWRFCSFHSSLTSIANFHQPCSWFAITFLQKRGVLGISFPTLSKSNFCC